MGRAFEFRKARKMKRWSKMAKTFTKIGKDISISVKAGGPDPDSNAQLRAAIQNAKAANMPKDNIERAIAKASAKDAADFKEVLFEGYAMHGIAVLIEVATDNNQRSVANIRSYFNKTGGSLGTSGSVEFQFEHKCHFKINSKREEEAIDLEELEFELIDHGAEEVFADDEFIMIYGIFENFGSLQSALEAMGHEIVTSGFERIPTVTKALSEEQEADVEKLLDKLNEDGDVQEVYHTMG